MATRQRARPATPKTTTAPTAGTQEIASPASPRRQRKPPTAAQSGTSAEVSGTTDSEAAASTEVKFVGEQLSYKSRYERIAEIAYGYAQVRGFAPGGEIDDWLRAEREVDALLGGFDADSKRVD